MFIAVIIEMANIVIVRVLQLLSGWQICSVKNVQNVFFHPSLLITIKEYLVVAL